MKNTLLIFGFLVTTSLFAQESIDNLLKVFNTHSIPYISVEELRRLQLHEPVVILDAREKEEYEVSHIASAKYIGFTEFASEVISKEITNKNTPLVVYCSLGIRSEEIGEKLKKAGFTNVKNLYGGVFKWKNKGYPVIDSTGNKTERVHAYSILWGKWLTKAEKVY
ncbi:rhodanese-related sulfurtransferase [Ulvibacter sp. MAR_2010_11]|uniref:rhodanese-like domain-containing protein n=1 Tax=Ulvibacter sp. MAR_2010_11 TaxID=1250229 RepID=UPI000C2BE967|nr:rhodanese-like domain-containing protein [Ulvibacter sp. MAR_2010_11]PKA82527.1 rhodanese-related sulfurtransferase [Ulvibacter sp. MAR_2010_11]